MKLIYLSTLLMSLCSICCQQTRAQEQNISRHTVYAEGFTPGQLFSLNYDHVFRAGTKMNWSYRVGFGMGKNTVALPLGLQAFSRAPVHHIEYSLLLLPFVEKYDNLFSGENLSDKKMYVLPALGYRFQKANGGFFARIAAGPSIYLDPPSDHFWSMDVHWDFGAVAGAGWSF